MLSCEVQGALRHGYVVHTMSQPAIGKPVLAHVEALALAAKNIFLEARVGYRF